MNHVRPPVYICAPITRINARPDDPAAELELQRRELLGRIAVRDGRAPFWEPPFRCFENGHDAQMAAASIAHMCSLTVLGQFWVLDSPSPSGSAANRTAIQLAALDAWNLRRATGEGFRASTWDGWKAMAERYNFRDAWFELSDREWWKEHDDGRAVARG